MKLVDLFAGIGTFSYVANKNGIECVFANDFVKDSKTIFDANHTHPKLTLKDMMTLTSNEIPTHDILTAGLSCQPFSIAGAQKGFDDERAKTFWKLIEIITFHKPQVVIIENVKNLLSHNKGKTFEQIFNNLQDIGYYVKYSILDTCKITTIPQHRERVYIMCFRDKDKYNQFHFPSAGISDKKTYVLNNFLDTQHKQSDTFYYTPKVKVYDLINSNVTASNTFYQYRRTYVRENKSGVCPTLTHNMGSGGHNIPIIKDEWGIRKITPRECFNLQGFPRDFNLTNISNSGIYKLIGNAVSVPIIDLIFKELIRIFH